MSRAAAKKAAAAQRGRARRVRPEPGPERIAPGGAGQVVSIAALREDPQNARLHPAENVDAIKASLQRSGQQKPIVHRGGVVIAGNGTLRAAIALGWRRVWAVESDLETDAERIAFAIADNRTAELAEWDPRVLLEQLQAMRAVEADIAGALGFDEEALKRVEFMARGKAAPESFDVQDPNASTDHRCPKCGYEWSGNPSP